MKHTLLALPAVSSHTLVTGLIFLDMEDGQGSRLYAVTIDVNLNAVVSIEPYASVPACSPRGIQ